jgi:hypothetical protein
MPELAVESGRDDWDSTWASARTAATWADIGCGDITRP